MQYNFKRYDWYTSRAIKDIKKDYLSQVILETVERTIDKEDLQNLEDCKAALIEMGYDPLLDPIHLEIEVRDVYSYRKDPLFTIFTEDGKRFVDPKIAGFELASLEITPERLVNLLPTRVVREYVSNDSIYRVIHQKFRDHDRHLLLKNRIMLHQTNSLEEMERDVVLVLKESEEVFLQKQRDLKVRAFKDELELEYTQNEYYFKNPKSGEHYLVLTDKERLRFTAEEIEGNLEALGFKILRKYITKEIPDSWLLLILGSQSKRERLLEVIDLRRLVNDRMYIDGSEMYLSIDGDEVKTDYNENLYYAYRIEE